MGKSALVVNIAENAAVDHNKAVALFSLEMSETELAQRFIASQAKLDGDELRKGRVKPDRWPKVIRATEQLSRAQLFVDDSSDLGVMELRAKCRRLHSRHELGLIVVDYLQLMRPEDTSIGRVEQIGQMSRGLKILARELHVPVIAVSQLSRAVESRPDKRPLLSDLRESGSIEQDADVVMFIYRDEYYNDRHRGARARPRSSSPSTATARSARRTWRSWSATRSSRTCGATTAATCPPGRTRTGRDSHARRRHRRGPVGGRGQGQGHRPPRRAGRRGHPLPGRQQRRPHDRPRRRGLQVPPDPVGDPLPRQAVGDRERRGRGPARSARGARRAAPARHLLARASASRRTRT